ncbi:tetratricopeptide-like helical domain-containing protein [Tanacetum coccineum]
MFRGGGGSCARVRVSVFGSFIILGDNPGRHVARDRAGELGKAWYVVNNMPNNVNVSVSVWGALLSACCDHGHVDLGKFAAQRALEMDPTNTGVYVLLSNMYARYGLWDEIEQLRILMHDKGLTKDIGCSRIEVTR